MADPKDSRGFFRKVVNFVVNPGTEWGDSGKPAEATQDSEFDKNELKALIERKRRNDFVRKRELDMLRKLRRQGLTPEQLAALGSSSGMADTEGRLSEADLPPVAGMKAKIDAIEQQMVGQSPPAGSRRPPADPSAPVAPPPRSNAPAMQVHELRPDDPSLADTVIEPTLADEPAPAPPRVAAPVAAPAPAPVADGPRRLGGPDSMSLVEVVEAAHDPELDEAVMAYANGDSDQAEQLLMGLIRQGGGRGHHAETWMVVFDLYRATGQQAKFEAIALEYVQRFGHSAPHWFSVPRMIAEAVTPARQRPARIDGKLSWTAPSRLDGAAVAALGSKTQLQPLPWVFDFSALREIDTEACAALLAMARHWATQPLDMRWIGGDQLLTVLAEATPVGVRETDVALWQLRLQLLRLVNRPDQFDEVAIDYCVTFEVSPPSWETTACQVRVSSSGGPSTNIAPTTIIGEANSSFVESQLTEEPGLVKLVQLELSGQLLGDISGVLRQLDEQIGEATLVEVSCARLLRVDFMAAGDLLNWVLACGRAGRHVSFTDAIRVVALFFSAIGIDEHASVKVRVV